MLGAQALEILALRPGATSSEIKEAYRDMVKVWHPDRFGDDARLREKAEHQLKLINEAYRTLQSDQSISGVYAATPGGVYSSPAPASAVPQSRRNGLRFDRRSVAWICGGLLLLVILVAGYLARHDATIQDVAPSAQVIPTTSTSGDDVRPKRAAHANGSGQKQFGVRPLSDAETDRMQMRCSARMRTEGEAAYEDCLRAQVAMLAHPTSAPDLSALSDAERESIEKTCAEPRLRGPEWYNRCLTAEAAALAAEPARADLSALSDADRQGVEAACSNAKDREGPAAYNRCLERFVEALKK